VARSREYERQEALRTIEHCYTQLYALMIVPTEISPNGHGQVAELLGAECMTRGQQREVALRAWPYLRILADYNETTEGKAILREALARKRGKVSYPKEKEE
jgi:hypothetical protein